MAITESFKYIVPYIHQCKNTTLEIPLLGKIPNPSPVNDPDVKKPIETKKILGSAQCGLTSIGMLCNYWLKLKQGETDFFNNTNLINLYGFYDKEYKEGKTQLSNFEMSVGFPSIVRNIFKSKGLESILAPSTFHPSDLYEYKHELDKSENYVLDILDNCGPVILHGRYDHLTVDKKVTQIGHYSVLIGYDIKTKSYIVNDPFYTYDFTKNLYIDPAGQEVYYPSAKFIKNLTKGDGKRGIRIMYVKEKNP